MGAATNINSGPSATDSSKPVNSPSTSGSGNVAERQRREERLIALYMELTGANEAAARSVYMHLGLGRDSSSTSATGG